MKLLFENWRKYIEEEMNRDNFVCPEINPYGKTYYTIDRNNHPYIEQILNCWSESRGTIGDSNINNHKPAYYPTEEITPYREYAKERLRRNTKEYEELKADIEKNGIREPLFIELGLNGKAKVGEGNHRHQIALELGLERVPVAFVFWREVIKNK